MGPTRTGRRAAAWCATLLAVALVAAACGDDDDDDAGDDQGSDTTEAPTDTTAAPETSSTTAGGGTTTTAGGSDAGDSDLPPSGPELGTPNPASGDSVKIGYFNDNGGPVDQREDTIIANAVVDYWNEYQGGVGGRPIDLVVCETRGDPAIATDCGNRFVEEDVVAVVTATSGYISQVYAPVNAAGIPNVEGSNSIPDILADGELTAILVNGSAQSFGFPVAVAQREGIDNMVTLVIDVPGAVEPVEPFIGSAAAAAGITFDYVAIPPGTPDMLPQVTAALEGGAGLVHIIGNADFCVVALRALYDSGFEGEIVTADYCVNPDSYATLPSDLVQSLRVAATSVLGDDSDPDWQLYEAIMDEYAGQELQIDGVHGWTYMAMFTLLWTMQDMDPADISAATVAAAINEAPERHLPLGGGTTFVCDGTAFPVTPASCTAATLETQLDAEGNFGAYELVDVSAQLEAIAAALSGG